MIRSIVILGIAMAAYTQANYISVSNGHGFGKWGDEKTCPGVHPALGFRIKVEPNQGSGDDTALNAIELLCADGTRVTSSVGE